MTRTIYFVWAILFTHSLVTQATDKSALVPGQVIVEFSSKDTVNLYAFKAQKIDILNELSRYLNIELHAQNQLSNMISIELNQQSIDSVFSQLLGDLNYIVRYEIKTADKIQNSKLEHYKTPPGSLATVADNKNDQDHLVANSSDYDHTPIIDQLENYGDLKNPAPFNHLTTLNGFESNSQLLALTESLGDIGTQEAVNQLGNLVNDKSMKVREAAIYALGDIGSAAAANILGLTINDTNSKFCDLVISELALINNDDAVFSLMKNFHQFDFELQIKLLKAVSEINTPMSKTYLWDIFNNDDSQISIYAYELLNQGMQ